MSKLWHLNVNATFLKWMAKVDDSQHHRDFALCSHWFQYTSREPMKEDAGNPLTYKLTNISIVSDCLCSVGLHFKINHKTTTYFAPQLCYMNICFSVIIVKEKQTPKHQDENSAGCSHSAWCAFRQQEGDNPYTSSSSHLNKFKTGLFFFICNKHEEALLDKSICKTLGKKSYWNDC